MWRLWLYLIQSRSGSGRIHPRLPDKVVWAYLVIRTRTDSKGLHTLGAALGFPATVEALDIMALQMSDLSGACALLGTCW